MRCSLCLNTVGRSHAHNKSHCPLRGENCFDCFLPLESCLASACSRSTSSIAALLSVKFGYYKTQEAAREAYHVDASKFSCGVWGADNLYWCPPGLEELPVLVVVGVDRVQVLGYRQYTAAPPLFEHSVTQYNHLNEALAFAFNAPPYSAPTTSSAPSLALGSTTPTPLAPIVATTDSLLGGPTPTPPAPHEVPFVPPVVPSVPPVVPPVSSVVPPASVAAPIPMPVVHQLAPSVPSVSPAQDQGTVCIVIVVVVVVLSY